MFVYFIIHPQPHNVHLVFQNIIFRRVKTNVFKMEQTKAFYDFCVPYTNDQEKLRKILKGLKELGYKTVAIEQIYDHTKRNTTKKQNDIIPAPVDLDFLRKEFQNKLEILQRLTIIYSDVAVAHAMTNSTNVKKYNLLAGLPTTEIALNHCCTTLNVDIVAFDQDECKLFISRKTYQGAVKRGMCFEIKYAPIILNSTLRKDMIKIAHNYHAKGKSKNIIFSSGATDPFDLRSPYDVANLSLIFGLSEDQGKASISSTCKLLYLKSESRRIGKTIMFVKNLKSAIVFSSSDDDESSDNDEDTEMENLEIQKELKSSCNVDEDESNNEQPKKKKKLS